MTAYRRDIDGLRALAIVPVVLFHLGVPGFPGGFVGVDVFFVISGFLITGIIASEIDAGHFSFARFYERRARRILPALLVMIAFVLAGASWLYLPPDFENVPWSALATLGFIANLWFFIHTNYFSSGSETMPLLHTWSLAVEEQFYLAMPLLLWAIARWLPHWRTLCLAAATLASLGLCIAFQTSHATANFYFPVTRAWELLTGALLASAPLARPHRQWLCEALALAGLALIAVSIVRFDSETHYPGIATLPPVLGAALLLYAAPGTLAGRLLAMPLPVGIGLISYSLYLWHWPLITFALYQNDNVLSGGMKLALFAAALVAAWASWRFVERPFRRPAGMPRRRIIALGGLGVAALALVAGAMAALGGWEARFSPQVVQIAAAAKEYDHNNKMCIGDALDDYPNGCLFGATVTPSALVWGDSHAMVFARALGEERKARGRSLVLHALSGCYPVLSATAATPDCAKFNARVWATLIQSPSITRIFLAANWPGGDCEADSTIANLDATIARLQAAGKAIVIIGPVPGQTFKVPRHVAQSTMRGHSGEPAGISSAVYLKDKACLRAHYPRWRAQGIVVLDPARGLVAGEHTRIALQGLPLYIDNHHLSMAGARAVLAADPSR